MSTVFTPPAILSYPNLFVPDAYEEGDKPAYSAVLIFTKEAQEDPKFLVMKKAAYEAAVERWGDKAKDVIKKAKNPTFRTDGDEKGYPEGSVFCNVRSYRQPQVVSRVPDPETGKPMLITEEMAGKLDTIFEIYPGCIVHASVVAVAYEVKGNKGVSFWLNNVQKLGEGERLAGAVPADEEFEADEEAAAMLEDLTEEEFDEPDGGNAMSEAEEVELVEEEEEPEPEKPKKKPAKKKAKAKEKPKGKSDDVDLSDLF